MEISLINVLQMEISLINVNVSYNIVTSTRFPELS